MMEPSSALQSKEADLLFLGSVVSSFLGTITKIFWFFENNVFYVEQLSMSFYPQSQ